MTLLGYFDEPEQTEPAVDPGLAVICPFCAKPLSEAPRVTTSLMREDRSNCRSWFYRAHKTCNDALPDDEIAKYEEAMLRWKTSEELR